MPLLFAAAVCCVAVAYALGPTLRLLAPTLASDAARIWTLARSAPHLGSSDGPIVGRHPTLGTL